MSTLDPGLRPDFERWPPAEAARHRAVLGIDSAGSARLLADRPVDSMLLEVAEARLQRPVDWQVCEPGLVDAWLATAEAQGRAMAVVAAEEAPADELPAGEELTLASMGNAASPAVRRLDAMLYDALKDGASDVHFERHANGAEVRLRLDGVMLPLGSVDGAALAEQMVSRLKVMAELDIGERRVPQDGRFRLRMQGRNVDFRLSIMPSVHGEDAAVRLLDRGSAAPSLAELGFDPAIAAQVIELARAPHGMLLVTGPTGSGKTTTLYAAMSAINQGREKIITIEDPVEYQLAGVVQIPVNERKGLTFARGLRAILRHDPDRVLVGEIRDAETAQIAVQAALTGHLVYSTVHANNAFDVLARFMHMGLDLYNTVVALNAVLAQRLVRRLCEHCAEPVTPTVRQREVLAGQGAEITLRAPRGCALCRGTGYRGRQAVAELLLLDDGLRDMIAARAPMSQIKQLAQQRGMQPLQQAAIARVCSGQTSWEELDRVVPGA